MKMILSDEIPYEEMTKVGLSKEDFLRLPNEILDVILTGRLSPVMKLTISDEENTHSLLAKICLKRGIKDVKLYIYPLMKEVTNDLGLSKKEIARLRNGEILRKKIEDDGKSVLSYIQLDRQINTLISVPVNMVYIPSIIHGVTLSKEKQTTIKDGKVLEIKELNCCIGIDIKERSGLRYRDGNYNEWEKEMLIEWDRLNPNVVGFWNTSQNGWEYSQITDKNNQTFKIK